MFLRDIQILAMNLDIPQNLHDTPKKESFLMWFVLSCICIYSSAGHHDRSFISYNCKAPTLNNYHNKTCRNIPLLDGKMIKKYSSLLTLPTSPLSGQNITFD